MMYKNRQFSAWVLSAFLSISSVACSQVSLTTPSHGIKAVQSNTGLSHSVPLKHKQTVIIDNIKRAYQENIDTQTKKEFFSQTKKQFQQVYQWQAKTQSFSTASATPIQHVNEDFSTASADFGNNGTDGWTQWGGDYYPVSGQQAVSLYNPQGHSGTFQTGLYKTVPLTANAGDSFIAKMDVATTFTSTSSDSTLVLIFNDPANTVVVSNTARGPHAKTQTLHAEALIPAGATQVVISPLVFLGQDETSSLMIHQIQFEQIPANYYTSSTLFDDPLDTTTNNIFGSNSPAGVDEEFGYDFYVVDNWPMEYVGDKAVTLHNSGPGTHASPEGGISKKIPLNNYAAGDMITARVYIAPTFSDTNSHSSMGLEFYDAGNQLIGTARSDAIYGNSYRWAIIDREPIPSGAAYLKITPQVQLGAQEASSLLWNDLKVLRHSPEGLTPPNDTQESCNSYVCMITEIWNDRRRLSVRNPELIDSTMTFDANLSNLSSTTTLPVTLTIPGQQTLPLTTLNVNNPAQNWTYNFSYSLKHGSIHANHDDSYQYRLPFATGSSHYCGQGYNGSFSHHGESSNALDFNMPIGTPIHAARGGTVVAIEESYSGGGTTSYYLDKANYVQIKHEDLTIGRYVHLNTNGVAVELGDTVQEGQLIGYSGNTGYSSGPHLHFDIYKAINGSSTETIQSQFKTSGGVLTITSGQSYTAVE